MGKQACGKCGGAGVVDSGQRSKWTGAKFVTCPSCNGSGVR